MEGREAPRYRLTKRGKLAFPWQHLVIDIPLQILLVQKKRCSNRVCSTDARSQAKRYFKTDIETTDAKTGIKVDRTNAKTGVRADRTDAKTSVKSSRRQNGHESSR